MAGHNIYGDIGDFFNDKAAEYTDAASQVFALGMPTEANELKKKAAHCCELFSAYRTRQTTAKGAK